MAWETMSHVLDGMSRAVDRWITRITGAVPVGRTADLACVPARRDAGRPRILLIPGNYRYAGPGI